MKIGIDEKSIIQQRLLIPVERRIEVTNIILSNLGKDIEKYKDSVDKCDISTTNSLSHDVGARMIILEQSNPTSSTIERMGDLKRQYQIISDTLKLCDCRKSK